MTMQAVKNQINLMKEQAELSEDRIIKFESTLRKSKQHLEAALKEKESLYMKIEAVEAQIINADRQREDITDKLQALHQNIDHSESKRKVLENRELEGDDALQKLENRLKCVRKNYEERAVRCEEAERRLAALAAEYNNVHNKRVLLEEQAKCMENNADHQLLKLRRLEENEMRFSAKEFRNEDQLKHVESFYLHAEERKELGRLNVMRLQRLIDQTQDEMETLKSRTRATRSELQNTIHTV